MTAYGIYSTSDGGFIEDAEYTASQAAIRLGELVAEDPENADDLVVCEIEEGDFS